MKTRTFVIALVAVVGFCRLAPLSHADLILSSSGTPDENRSDFTGTVGTRFETGANALLVTALGFEDTGFGSSHKVGIWTDAGVLVGAATVSGADPLMGSQWRFSSSLFSDAALTTTISSITLAANTVYRLGGEVSSGGDAFTDDFVGDGVINFALNTPLTTMGPVVNDFSGGGFSFPNLDGSGPDFRWAPANALFQVIPEPSTIVIWSGLGLGFWWRRPRGRRSA